MTVISVTYRDPLPERLVGILAEEELLELG